MTPAHRLRAWLPLMLCLGSLFPNPVNGQGIERPRVPLRTALDELRTLRESYADAYNKKDTATLLSMYAPDATVIRDDGTVLKGKDAIRESLESGPLSQKAGPSPKMSITSDTVRVFGNSAWDVGTVRISRAGGEEEVSHYLAVFRRGVSAWRISSVAVVPEKGKGTARDSAER